MSKTLKGAAIGFLVAGGLGFAVVTGVLSREHNEDFRNYAPLGGLLASPLWALVGGWIGAVVGAALEWRGGHKGSSRVLCFSTGVLLCVGGSLGGIVLGFWNVKLCIGLVVIGFLLCLAAALISSDHDDGSASGV